MRNIWLLKPAGAFLIKHKKVYIIKKEVIFCCFGEKKLVEEGERRKERAMGGKGGQTRKLKIL